MTQREIYKDQMHRLGISNPKLAEKLSITPSTVSKWLKTDAVFAKHSDEMNKAMAAIIAEEATAEESTAVDHDQASDQSVKEIGMVALPTPDAPDPDDDRLPWEDAEEPTPTFEDAVEQFRKKTAAALLEPVKAMTEQLNEYLGAVNHAFAFDLISLGEYSGLRDEVTEIASALGDARKSLEGLTE